VFEGAYLVKARYMTTGIAIKIRWKAAKTTIEGAICMPSLSKLQKSEKGETSVQGALSTLCSSCLRDTLYKLRS
jgi:hypothetical protein